MSATTKYPSDSLRAEKPMSGGPSHAWQRDTAHDASAPDSTIQAASDALKDMGRKASEAINEFADNATATTERMREEVSRRVEEQPVTSLLIAASVGLILGILLVKR